MADGGNSRLYQLEAVLGFVGQTQADDAEFNVASFTIEDELNVGYRVKVVVEAPTQEFAAPYDSTAPYRNKTAQLTLRRHYQQGPPFEHKILGLIHGVRRITVPAPLPQDQFEVEVVPAFTVLENHTKGQIWHEKTYPDVLREVLAEGLGAYGRSFEDKITRDYPIIDFIVRRPDESLADFVKKLCRRTGINFYFSHKGSMEVMVLTDDNGGFEDGEQKPGFEGVPIHLVWSDGDHSDREELLTRYDRSHSMRVAKTVHKGFDVIGTPAVPAEKDADVDGGHGATNTRWNLGRVNELEDPVLQMTREVTVDTEIQTNIINQANLEGQFSGFLAGRKYPLVLHGNDQRDYIITKVSGSGTNMGQEDGQDYTVFANAVPVTSDSGGAINIRAIRDAPPANEHVVYRAEVVALENAPVDVDEFMRMRVKFQWDTKGDPALTYVSVVQPIGGTHGGMQWLPREGDRVLVAFLGNDAERPFIIGSVFDAEHKPPPMGPPPNQNPGRTVIREQHVLPLSRTWVGWNQSSIDDKSRQSMLQMEVTAGAELMYANAPFDYRLDVGNDSDIKVERDAYHWVVNQYFEKIGYDGGVGDYDQQIENNRNEQVGGEYTLNVDKSRTTTIKENETRTVDGKGMLTVKDGQTFEIHKKFAKNIMQGDDVTNCFDGSFLVGADNKIFMRAPDIDFSESGGTTVGGGSGAAPGGFSLKGRARLYHEVEAAIVSGQSKIVTDPEGILAEAPAINTRDKAGASTTMANASYVVDAPRGITFRCGTNEIRMTPEGIYINGQHLVMRAGRTDLHTSSFNIVHPDAADHGDPE